MVDAVLYTKNLSLGVTIGNHYNVKAPERQQTIRRDVLASLHWYILPENAEKIVLENIFPIVFFILMLWYVMYSLL